MKMRHKDKRALSELVAYVLLIVITISISTIVYAWLKCYIPGVCGTDIKECPEGTSLIIKDYTCNMSDKQINITIKNKGLFSIDGFIIKVNDRESSIGIYTLKKDGNSLGEALAPGKETSYSFSLTSDVYSGEEVKPISHLAFIEVQPIIKDHGQINYCTSISSQLLNC